MDQGEAIFRPSSKVCINKEPMIVCNCNLSLQGSDHLTVTWKVNESIHQHIDILEKDKPNAFSLGKSLWIGEEVKNYYVIKCLGSLT